MKPPAPAPDTGEIEALLGEGCIALGIHLTPAQRAQLIDYLVLLSRWNRSFNLTAVRDLRDMLTRHVLDSLSVLPHLKGRALADVGPNFFVIDDPARLERLGAKVAGGRRLRCRLAWHRAGGGGAPA